MADGRSKNGGSRSGAGRPSKAAELGLQALLDECWTEAERKTCIKNLAKTAKDGEMESLKLLLAYTYGKPVDRKEIKGDENAPVIIREVVIERRTSKN